MGNDLQKKVIAPGSGAAPENRSNEIPVSAITLIKEFEGCELEAYPDPATGGEPWTIGVGATFYQDGKKVKSGDRITQEDADKLLKFHLKGFWENLEKTIPYWNEMTANQRGCLLSFSFNTGYTYPMDGFNTLNKCLQFKSWNSLESALQLYVNPGSPAEVGLKRRRIAEFKLWKA
jgi:lysozyme